MDRLLISALMLVFSSAFLLTGCSQPKGPGMVYYLDGAGGGLIGWSSDVEEGLRQGGYDGRFEAFRWQTGLGPAADHMATADYKMKEAGKLADKISAYQAEHPGEPICVMALSAGSAVGLFALEQMPADQAVETLFLLSPSVSADYNLTPALEQVRYQSYVYTSANDLVLQDLVKVIGGAEQPLRPGEPAGLYGFRGNYARLEQIPWRPTFKRYGHEGGHTDVTEPDFVAREIAPRLLAIPGFGNDVQPVR